MNVSLVDRLVLVLVLVYNSRSGAFGRVLSYDGQTLSRSEDVGHRFDSFFIQTPSPQMPRAFGEVGWAIGSPKHHEKAPGRPLPWDHRGQPLFRERRVVGQRAPPPLIQRARAARTYAWNIGRSDLGAASEGTPSLFLFLLLPNISLILVSAVCCCPPLRYDERAYPGMLSATSTNYPSNRTVGVKGNHTFSTECHQSKHAPLLLSVSKQDSKIYYYNWTNMTTTTTNRNYNMNNINWNFHQG